MLALSASKSAFITFTKVSVMTGEPFIFPADTIYGIGASIKSEDANRKIYKIKKRNGDMPFPVLAGSFESVKEIAHIDKEHEEKLIELWSGITPCTVILPAMDKSAHYALNGTVAVRLVRSGYLQDALHTTGPVTATSVNISGSPYLKDFTSIVKEFSGVCRFILKGVANGSPSDIYKVSQDKIIKVR